MADRIAWDDCALTINGQPVDIFGLDVRSLDTERQPPPSFARRATATASITLPRREWKRLARALARIDWPRVVPLGRLGGRRAVAIDWKPRT